MKNKLLKTLMPLVSIAAVSAPLINLTSCGKKDIEIVTVNDEILPMSMLKNNELELKVKDKKTDKEIKNVVFSSDSKLISIEGNKITAITPGEATIKCEVEGQEPKEFILDVADQTYSFDFTQDIEYKITPKGDELETAKATEVYLDEAISVPRIIAEDVAFTWVDMKIVDSGYEKLDVTPVYITKDKSFLNIKIHSEGKVPQGGGEYNMISLDIEYRNIPVMVNYSEQTKYSSHWGMSPSASILTDPEQYFLNNNDWLYYQKDVYDNGESLIHYWDSEKLKADPQSEADIGIMVMAFMFSLPMLSHYLSETTPK